MADQRLESIISDYAVLDKGKFDTVKKHLLAEDLKGFIDCGIFTKKVAMKIWEEHQGILYLRNPVQEGPYKLSLSAIIMGTCGSGKTALMNNMVGSNYDSAPSMISQTRNIQCERIAYVNGSRLRLYDTPGTTALDEVSKHATLLKASLTFRPYNVIFINVKYNNRGKELIHEMMMQTNMVKAYSKNVVYLVSHFDQAKDPEGYITGISEEMNKRDMLQQVVFYSNEYWNQLRLSTTLYQIVSNYPETRIFISEAEFHQNFRIGHIDERFKQRFQITFDDMKTLPELYIQAAYQIAPADRAKILPEMALDLKYRLQETVDNLFKQQ